MNGRRASWRAVGRGARAAARVGLAITALAVTPVGTAAQAPKEMTDLATGTEALLQAVSPAGEDVVWISGHEGVVIRTLDGGETWLRRPVQTLDSLQFRDIHAFDADRAVILSAGEGDLSRIYRTADGGATWTLAWTNAEPAGFYDCLDFWDDRRGLAYGDSVDGELRILLTDDGGASWRIVPPKRLPPAVEGEGGFAASGTCVETGPAGAAWIGTGAGARPRLLATRDHGETWTATDLPIVRGEAAGAFTVGFLDERFGVALGGDLGAPEATSDNVAVTGDGGASWIKGRRTPMPGAVYGSALGMTGEGLRLIAAGPGGLAVTADLTEPWTVIDEGPFWAVSVAGSTAWAAGPNGRVLRLEW